MSINANNKLRKYKFAGYTLFFIVVIVAVVVGLYNLFDTKESYSASEEGNFTIASMHCESKRPVGAFFVPKNAATSENHEIKITFVGDKPDKISYRYTGTFDTAEQARGTSADFHAKYDRYMAENEISDVVLSPYFANTREIANANLFAEKDTLNAVTSTLFFLEPSEALSFQNYKNTTLKKIFTARGFSCKES